MHRFILLLTATLLACSGSGKSSTDTLSSPDSVATADLVADTVAPADLEFPDDTLEPTDQTQLPDNAGPDSIDPVDALDDVGSSDLPQLPDTSDTTDPDVVEPEVPSPFEFAGRVQVIQQKQEEWDGSGSVGAEFHASPVPTTQVVVKEEGDCKVLVGESMMPWNCETECEWGIEACINGECIPLPPLASAGTVSVTGLNKDVTLEPTDEGYYASAYGLAEDFMTPGEAIVATATGDATPAFELHAIAVEPLVAKPSTWDFEPGKDYEVTWEAGDGSARIQLLINTGWHGSPNLTTIWCETDDDGELTVPASLTADFPIPSCGECEGSYISRFTRDIVDLGNGPIELFVASQYWFVAWWGGW